MPVVALKTFGCKVNRCDTAAMALGLRERGFEAVPAPRENADAFLVNTCAVTARAVQKTAKHLRGLRRDHPRAPIAVYGCAVSYAGAFADVENAAFFERGAEAQALDFLQERLLEDPESQIPKQPCRRQSGRTLTAENGEDAEGHGRGFPRNTPRFPRLDPSPIAAGSPGGSPSNAPGSSVFQDSGSPSPLSSSRTPGQDPLTLGRTRAFVKVADGCDGRCTFCVVPRLRGPFRSRPLEEILEETRALAGAGHREIVPVAVHLGCWGEDLDPPRKPGELVEKIASVPGVERVRLSSLESAKLGEDLLDLAGHEGVAPHFHLPLQSGDASVLERMGRGYTPEAFLDAVDRIRKRFPTVAVTTDVIAGFPGESEDAFGNTLALCRKAAFSRIHAFPFSVRPGTPAASYPDLLSKREIRARMDALLSLGRALAERFRAGRIGATDRVLLERPVKDRPGFFEGLDGVYQRVIVPALDEEAGRLVDVRITGVEGNRCVGERV